MPVSETARSGKDGIAGFSALFLCEGTSILFTLGDLGGCAVLRFGASVAVLDFAGRAFFAFEKVTFAISTLDQTLILSVGK
jgi:hypothetical protein